MEGQAKDCIHAVEGQLLQGNPDYLFRGVSINSRTVSKGELFVCVKGERFDGHDFLADVISREAAGIILSDPNLLPDKGSQAIKNLFVIQVPDTLKALQDLASFQRKRFPFKVVAVTGTNGKSTTKEMIASILETKFTTLKTQGNLNNHIGLPLTLLKREPSQEVGVLEMGMSAAGEIKRLAEIAQPDIGIITNISEGHLVQLKSLKNIQSAKGELFDSLTKEGTAIVNADDPLVLELAQSLRAKTVTFGIDQPADVRASEIESKDNLGFRFKVKLFDKTLFVHLPYLGYCNIYNTLAALATGYSLGIQEDAMTRGLENYQRMSQRNELTQHNGIDLINDSYNANPRSMTEALKTLDNFKTQGRRIFVIGDMLELGDLSIPAHETLGEEISRSKANILIAVGKLASLSARRAQALAGEKIQVLELNEHQEAADYLIREAKGGDCVMFKGSRGAAMEKILQIFSANKN
ncbi:MAG: UDP-N-acetylmuramoyl-tripeptide--D-alanyl-D-alanine ligase [Nitrospina sp.]|jgi:UDP-N-acetylmuramoyl-tripeptide--D-alanyl-D-alanine ligase|nr:UDP-N-acetylmuramoyl-tripeptide--D-alanyl-D-alanine ligase [Nitrospina sp.]MBT3508795.1 UDP-N-acetylmuramoyl-tripeptide--D-alanyl-D-alanine ligase [Nitrospina sp.]MBT3874573.1 UDP-N-acetylmuramoyl-tripeptide--D-alanyl-D-alanine ligase [Nitrospina sp.]MBT4047047.1 UDP-N-acetylmuramoyl-tripeptide--D-alanyl-D-alanine ligase [Nitrospina sp.]MBT4557931.1 UDP-N-acetylmuramoyl-tripeptide--D-alanyl-D-alanine ligase [Nitrospina sp.]